jgi:putative Mn2+ efflux pump MntP
MVVLAFAATQIAIVDEKIAPLSAWIGKAVGQRSELVTGEIIGLILLAVAGFALVRAGFDQRRSDEYESAGILLIGMLAIAVSSYFRFGFRY